MIFLSRIHRFSNVAHEKVHTCCTVTQNMRNYTQNVIFKIVLRSLYHHYRLKHNLFLTCIIYLFPQFRKSEALNLFQIDFISRAIQFVIQHKKYLLMCITFSNCARQFWISFFVCFAIRKALLLAKSFHSLSTGCISTFLPQRFIELQ